MPRQQVVSCQIWTSNRGRQISGHRSVFVFALFAGYDGRTGEYDSRGPFQLQFREFAENHAIPLQLSKQVLMSGESETSVQKYFQDQCHMKEIGTQKFGQGLADLLSVLPEHPSPATTF